MLINIGTKKKFEKNYHHIMEIFFSFDSDVKKFFDIFVDILIIPMTINFYKHKNFFKCFIKKEESDINLEEGNNTNINNNNDKNIFSTEDEEYLLNTLEKTTSEIYKIRFKSERKEESKYKLIILLIILFKEYKEFISNKNNDKNSERLSNIYFIFFYY